MIKYQYQVLRYIHDQFTQEFGNVGIILFAPEEGFLACKVVNRFSRLSDFFVNINGRFLVNSLNHFENKISEIAKDLSFFIKEKNIEYDLNAITNYILPKDDSALVLSKTIYGIDIDPLAAMNELYERIVEKYNIEGPIDKHTDHAAWRRVYKEYFDKYGITNKLKKHTITTKKDKIDFDKSWKNGTWHCYQSLAFDLKKEDSIKNKVYKWSGIIKELETANEKINLYFLTTSPTSDHENLRFFISEMLSAQGNTVQVKVIEENQAEQFVQQVKESMEQSNIL